MGVFILQNRGERVPFQAPWVKSPTIEMQQVGMYRTRDDEPDEILRSCCRLVELVGKISNYGAVVSCFVDSRGPRVTGATTGSAEETTTSAPGGRRIYHGERRSAGTKDDRYLGW